MFNKTSNQLLYYLFTFYFVIHVSKACKLNFPRILRFHAKTRETLKITRSPNIVITRRCTRHPVCSLSETIVSVSSNVREGGVGLAAILEGARKRQELQRGRRTRRWKRYVNARTAASPFSRRLLAFSCWHPPSLSLSLSLCLCLSLFSFMYP